MIGLTIPLKKPTMDTTTMTWKIHRHPGATTTPSTTTTTMRTIIIEATAILMFLMLAATWMCLLIIIITNRFNINNSEKNSMT